MAIACLAALLALPSAPAQPVEVQVGVYLLSFGNFDVTKGTYTMDFYLWFRWSPPRLQPASRPSASS